MDLVKRSEENPLLFPNKANSWEAEAVFNGCPVRKGKTLHLLYRALSAMHYHSGTGIQMNISDIGKAISSDGIHFKNRERFIFPEHDWERFGCEDPRVTHLGGKYYIFYTALSNHPPSGDGIKVGLAISKDLKKVDSKHLITPFNAKAMALFPEKIDGKMAAILTPNTDQPPSKIGLAFFNSESDMWSEDYWKEWYGSLDSHTLPLQRKVQDQIEVGAPPIKTEDGWLILYSYIRNYFSDNKIFGIEAVLLDLKDPHKIIGRTHSPILIPEEQYELYGMVPDVIFPSGAILKDKNTVDLYYGAADSTICVASINLKRLMIELKPNSSKIVRLERAIKNPILTPRDKNAWESRAVFNPAAVLLNNEVHILYRAMSKDNTSVMGYAKSRDGICIVERDSKPAYVPREGFEAKRIPDGNSGCEDGRITKVGNKLYMCYTAYNGVDAPRIALTSIKTKDFLDKKWSTWTTPVLISPPGHDNKDACVFPQKLGDKHLIFHRMGTGIDIAFVNDLDNFDEVWLEERQWLEPREGFWDGVKIGIASPPIKTAKGWVLLYHGISAEDHHYRVGAVLLDLKNPVIIKSRTRMPIFEPETEYEKTGQVGNVVFPCGSVVIKGILYVYYGGGDSVVGVATIPMKKLLSIFD